ncbi:hypothetical protein SAMN04488135_11475 [Pollutimonas bauzanensis]|uniref:Uncharacterized protein n=1 Tax=Pollutimonas bauzanensis TaxID=658167 RepID=A0A1M5ZF41_9BURK|nr:hypothetical protein SAMN04488135_11475 [Pollutimonas bauzanensis]
MARTISQLLARAYYDELAARIRILVTDGSCGSLHTKSAKLNPCGPTGQRSWGLHRPPAWST